MLILYRFDFSIKKNRYETFKWPNCSYLLKHQNYSKVAKRNILWEVLQKLKATVFPKTILSRTMIKRRKILSL